MKIRAPTLNVSNILREVSSFILQSSSNLNGRRLIVKM